MCGDFSVCVFPEDVDGSGTVHHASYLRFFERGRELLLDQGALVRLFSESGRSFVVTKVSSTFKHRPVVGDELAVSTIPTIESAYRLSFVQRVDAAGAAEPCALGRVEMVCVSRDMQMCALPDDFVSGLVGISAAGTAAAAAVPRLLRAPPRRRAADVAAAPPHVYPLTVWYECTDFTGEPHLSTHTRALTMLAFTELGNLDGRRDARAS